MGYARITAYKNRKRQDAPIFHLMSQKGCGENDPNGPVASSALRNASKREGLIRSLEVFDPVHGVIHQFYQDHLFYREGHGPIYGHFVSKDFVCRGLFRGLEWLLGTGPSCPWPFGMASTAR